MTTKKKGTIGYYKELAGEVGYPNNIEGNTIGQFLKWAREKGILVKPTDINRKDRDIVIKNAKCKTDKEYRDKCARAVGFKNNTERYRDYQREYRYNIGKCIPMEFNEDCSAWFGDFTENLMIQTFEGAIKMHYGNPGYDWVCKRGDKIDNKGRCLTDGNSRWIFEIDYNNIADWFILSAWDNRDSLTPLHVWIFHKNDIVDGRKFWRRQCLVIINNPEKLKKIEKYEFSDRLDKLKELYDRGASQ